MSKITLDNLSNSLKNIIEQNGLTEAQVIELIKNNISGDITKLNTSNKSSLVAAINELFQSANNGKQLIANAIGNPLITGNSTFSAMSEAILGLRRGSENKTDAKDVLYNMMIEDGYNNATSNMTVDELITLLDISGMEIGDIKQIACGAYHTFILKNDGSVWSCGWNYYGQLGASNTTTNTFTQVTTNINYDVKQIVCGAYHNFILKNDGSVWACGYNEYGQLGLNDTKNRKIFTQVTTNINNDVKQIACGYNHTFILKNDGSVWCCGYNFSGELGLGDNTKITTFTQVTNDVKQVACGDYHTFILKNDGSVWSCGKNDYGQLGLNDSGTGNKRTTFTQVTTNINNDVKQIDCGNVHAFILKNDGSVWSTGLNGHGQLGLNDTTNRSTFTNTNFSTGLSEYELNRQKLYYYLLDNDIPVTEDMDIGTMLDVLVDGYINNMILGYENNLRIILRDEGVSVNNEDNMASLITKVDEEFANKNNEIENSGGGLDIISATQLPATGKENQICVITDNPEGSFLITNIESDTNSNGFLIYNTNNTSITPISTTNGNVTQNYRISYVKQDTQYLATYIWSNGVWNVMTNANLILLENGAFKNTDISGGFNTGAYHTISDGSLNISIDTDGVKYTRASFKNQIDFTYYNTLKITLKASNSTSTPLRLYSGTACKSSRTSAPQVGNTVIATAKSSKQTLTLDITSWQGLGYLNLEAEPEEYVALIYVYYIELY